MSGKQLRELRSSRPVPDSQKEGSPTATTMSISTRLRPRSSHGSDQGPRQHKLTTNPTPTDVEPRRSIRATKGQHKALEKQDQQVEIPKRRGGAKKAKKAPEPEEPEEEVIRCVCGATEQDEDSGEPWIACDQCGAWQHNICMGMSQYTEDLPKEYFCELCRPDNHTELLEGMKNGERPWEARRKAYEEEKAEKKKRGPKKKKRASDIREDASQTSKQSPPPSAPAKDTKVSGIKRKQGDGAPEKDVKKARKADASLPAYTPPADLPEKIAGLPDTRQGPAKALHKSLVVSVGAAEKNGLVPADGVSTADRAERFALQIERAVHDTHPTVSSYASQIRTLAFNLKSNHELTARLLARTLAPPMLASMTTEELASQELRKETAEMLARAEKQSIKITEDIPRIRRTHKGDEIIGDEHFITSEDIPSAPVRRPSAPKQEPSEKPASIDTQTSPTRSDFDLNKVFSTVKSPTARQGPHRLSIATTTSAGPGVDPDVDRLLDDETHSPPYSPKEETDPDVVWRGNIVMNTIADVPVTAKHMGGANLSETIHLPWDKLIPRTLTVCGRIDEQQAIVYLCSLRYSLPTDIVVVSLEPTSPTAKAGMQKLIDYFVSKKRYGVVGDKGVANVRDTYLVPVLPGTGNLPEFMMNLADNFIPETRTEPMMLCVFVYRNDPETIQRIYGTTDPNHSVRMHQAAQNAAALQTSGTPTPTQTTFASAARASVSAPTFAPTTAQYPSPRMGAPAQQAPPPAPAPQPPRKPSTTDELQRQGEAVAREILGDLITSPTVAFLLPQAHLMSRREWEVIKKIYEQDPRTRDDLPYLGSILEREGQKQQQRQQQQQRVAQAPPPQPQPSQQHRPQPPVTTMPPQAHPAPSQPQQHPTHPVRTTPILPPPIPPGAAGPPRQTPIPPPPIPPQTAPGAGAPSA
ncbi:hypothetical protein VTJ49DRAFT_3733 [Mycothermus thermophilus]|uniref:Transcription factor BYE1 n=1 Tax=Humicola insolens TaxID=85995 RepID=A0ABR3V6T5_HUMIN